MTDDNQQSDNRPFWAIGGDGKGVVGFSVGGETVALDTTDDEIEIGDMFTIEYSWYDEFKATIRKDESKKEEK